MPWSIEPQKVGKIIYILAVAQVIGLKWTEDRKDKVNLPTHQHYPLGHSLLSVVHQCRVKF